MSRNKINAKDVFGSFLFPLTCMPFETQLSFSRTSLVSSFCRPTTVTNLSDYDGDLSFMDDEDIDEITFTNSNQNRRSLTGTSITSISEDRRSVSTLNHQNFDEIVQDEEGVFHFREEFFD